MRVVRTMRNYFEFCFRTCVSTAYNKTLMWKKFIDDPAIIEKVDLNLFFCQEQQVYQKIMSVLRCFAPDCIHADEKNIIMEDLAQKKYALCERRNFLDLKHTVYVLKVSFYKALN